MYEEQGERLEGRVSHLIYENEENGYTVFELESGGEYIQVSGSVGTVHIGETVTLRGKTEVHPTYGEQFKAVSCECHVPETKEDILMYLSAGSLPFIGPATAKKIVGRFGEKTLDIIAEEPMRLTEIKGISEEKAKFISETFKKDFGSRELVTWMARFDISAARAIEVYKAFGPRALSILMQNPYLLCGEPLQLPFKRADEIAAELQMSGEDAYRLEAALLYVLRHNAGNGHTCIPKERLLDTCSRYIGVSPSLLEEYAGELVERKELYERELMGRIYVFLPDMLSAELDIAAHLAKLAAKPVKMLPDQERNLRALEYAQGFEYEQKQREAVLQAVNQNVFVLTGGPGTGKTTTVNAILSLLEYRAERVALCAPTGRAAKRLSELTGRKASTIHRLLEVDGAGGAVRFIHNEKNRLQCDVVILDEMSMVDAKLFQSLLAALRPSCRVIMVGDADQLPSVGPGNVLGEIIKSGIVPTVCLTHIFRQAGESLIVKNAHRIVEGEMPENGKKSDNFFFLRSMGVACSQLICDLVCNRLPASYGFDPIKDIQVLCPTKLGPSGTKQLNISLQAMLNPPDSSKKEVRAMGQIYRIGDKVMQVRNNYDIPYEREGGESGVGAFNGDIGVIEQVDLSNHSVRVRMDDRVLNYPFENLNELEIAYAVTVHKSQGSEFPAVIIPVSEVPEKLCYRNLLYTGVTRGKQLCILAGNSTTVESMVNNVRQNLRYSGLSQFLLQAAAAEAE